MTWNNLQTIKFGILTLRTIGQFYYFSRQGVQWNRFLWSIFWFLKNYHLSRVMRKPAFCICENKDADQLRGYREGNRKADQRLCFRYMDSTIPLLPKSEISSL